MFVETDYSRFDASLSVWLLQKIERKLFRVFYPTTLFPILDLYLDQLFHITGKTAFGLHYSVQGTRASGDAHTSIMNGLINRFATQWAMQHVPSHLWASIHEGDDGLVACDLSVKDTCLYNLSCINLLGLCMRDVLVHESIHDAMFCGRLLVANELGTITSICDVPRTLAKYGFTISQLDPLSALIAKSLSYNSTDSNTPIIGPLSYKVLELHRPLIKKAIRKVKRSRSFSNFDKAQISVYAHQLGGEPNISPQARAAVELKWGIPMDTQIEIEQIIMNWSYIPKTWPTIFVDQVHVDTDDVAYFNWSSIW